MIKRSIIFALFLLFNFCAWSQKSKADTKWELAGVIRTTVFIRDSIKIKNITSIGDMDFLSDAIESNHEFYLNPASFEQFKESFYTIAYSKRALVYRYTKESKLTSQEIKEKYTMCDSVESLEFDHINGIKIWRCDSIERVNNIRAISFFETWYFNEKTKMIEKDVLAYIPMSYDFSKECYRPLFIVIKDEKSRKKISYQH